MQPFKQLIARRRSHRKFLQQPIAPEEVQLLLRAALMSPTSKNQRAWQFVVVDDPMDLQKLADSKEQGAQLIAGAAMAVVVLGDDTKKAWNLFLARHSGLPHPTYLTSIPRHATHGV